MSTYRIVRFHKDNYKPRVLFRGLTLEEAQRWCRDPETSSSTCKEKRGREHTERFGAWFDGYEEERDEKR